MNKDFLDLIINTVCGSKLIVNETNWNHTMILSRLCKYTNHRLKEKIKQFKIQQYDAYMNDVLKVIFRMSKFNAHTYIHKIQFKEKYLFMSLDNIIIPYKKDILFQKKCHQKINKNINAIFELFNPKILFGKNTIVLKESLYNYTTYHMYVKMLNQMKKYIPIKKKLSL
jgi:hypothetical protein